MIANKINKDRKVNPHLVKLLGSGDHRDADAAAGAMLALTEEERKMLMDDLLDDALMFVDVDHRQELHSIINVISRMWSVETFLEIKEEC